MTWAFWNSKQQRLRAGWRILLHFLLAIVGFIGIGVVLLVASLASVMGDASSLVFGAVAQSVILVGTTVLACFILDRRFFRDLGLQFNRRWWCDLLGGLILGAVLMAGIFAIQYMFGLITLGHSELAWHQTLVYQIGWIVAMISVGTSEEILSRGYHLKNLSEGFQRLGLFQSFLLASLISSSLFGAMHAMNPGATFFAVLNVVMAGMMFCVARVCTGSLAAPIGMHISWNYFQGAVFGFPVSGQTIQGSFFTIEDTVDSIWTGGAFGPEDSLMGLLALTIAMLVFAVWPKTTSVSQNLVQLVRFQPRTKRASAGMQ